MSIKKLFAEKQAHRIEGAIALAILSAPTIFSWERTISVDVLAEEVRTFLEIPKARVKSILKAIKKAIADIERQHPALGNYLKITIDTGYKSSYRPGRAD